MPCILGRLKLDDPPRGELGLLQRYEHRVIVEAGVLSHGSGFFRRSHCEGQRSSRGRSAPVLGSATIKPENRAIRSTAKDGAAETALDQDRQTSEPDRFASVCPRVSPHRLLAGVLDRLVDAAARIVRAKPSQERRHALSLTLRLMRSGLSDKKV